MIKSWKIGDINSGYPFYYKMEKNIIHTFIFILNISYLKRPQKDLLKKMTSFPNWAPKNNFKNLGLKYLKELKSYL